MNCSNASLHEAPLYTERRISTTVCVWCGGGEWVGCVYGVGVGSGCGCGGSMCVGVCGGVIIMLQPSPEIEYLY